MSINQEILVKMANGAYAPVDPATHDDTEFECPKCSGGHFGSYKSIYSCHDEFNWGCKWEGSKNECFVLTKQALAEELLETRKELAALKSDSDANKYGWY